MDDFAKKISEWLDTEPEARNIEQGALLLLKINRNRIAYDNTIRNPRRYAANLEYQLRRHLEFRLADVTHEQVAEMQVKAEEIYLKNFGHTEQQVQESSRGLRSDHDKLPSDIRKAYESAMEKRRRISQCHLKAREIMQSNIKCKDSELFPWVKEIISLDKEVHKLFKKYDTYKAK